MTDSEKLKEIIDEIDVLISHNVTISSPKFEAWHDKTTRFIYHRFGADSPEYRGFSKIYFSLAVYTSYDKTEDYVNACKQGLETAKCFLNNYLDELSEGSNENADTSDSEKDLERIFTRFRKVAVQLTRRHDGRETLSEYDVQDLLYALLKLYFDDVRPEEWTPSYAGGSSRTDFYIPEIKTFIEVKKTRSGLKDKELRDQLIIDIEQYQVHPGCDKIYCFVYDPDTILRNPSGIKKDFEEKHKGIVRVFIES